MQKIWLKRFFIRDYIPKVNIIDSLYPEKTAKDWSLEEYFSIPFLTQEREISYFVEWFKTPELLIGWQCRSCSAYCGCWVLRAPMRLTGSTHAPLSLCIGAECASQKSNVVLPSLRCLQLDSHDRFRFKFSTILLDIIL